MRLDHKYIIHFKLVLLLFFSQYSFQAFGQCNSLITLSSQLEVDHFAANGCTELPGGLVITGSDITNLNGLSNITHVKSLSIYLTFLTDLSGLQSLVTVDGTLGISENGLLLNLNGLQNLASIGSLYIWQNPQIADISQLINITHTTAIDTNSSFDGRIWIGENQLLTTLEGLQNITNIDGELNIQKNATLEDLFGLAKLQSVRKTMWIQENDMLRNLQGLDELINVGELIVFNNQDLVSLRGLTNLAYVPGGITINFNPSLTSVEGMDHLTTVGKKFILAVSPVNTLQGLFLESVGGTPGIIAEGFELLSLTGLINLTGLDNLHKVDGDVVISNNESLITLDGLNNLETIGGFLKIQSNVKLQNIEAPQHLESIGGDLWITGNDSLSFCSVPWVCSYAENPSGIFFIASNPSGCRDADEILAHCSPVHDIRLVDANLQIGNHGLQGENDITAFTPEELLLLDEFREGTTADGVSSLLLRLEFQKQGHIRLTTDDTSNYQFPWGKETYAINGGYYCFILYTPPEVFDPISQTYLFDDVVEAYDTEMSFEFTDEHGVRNDAFSIPLVRPPVVLVHGTYSDPVKAWKTPVTGGTSFFDRMVNEGFKVFAIDYVETNGTTGFVTDHTGFADNAKVVWGDVYPSNKGGINDALNYYRDSLEIAVTQVDVIGHSLGGILPRVYASAYFNPEYKRPENFMQGDINRLVTIASTHFGSHLGELQTFLNGLTPFNINTLDWIGLQAAKLISAWVGGASPSKAVMDQLPEPAGEALTHIGRTDIPSHAITCRVPHGALKDSIYDPDQEYFDMYWYITLLMYQSNSIRNAYLNSKLDLIDMGLQASTTIEGDDPLALYPNYNNLLLYKTMIEDALYTSGRVISVLDGRFELPTKLDIFKYALGETAMGDLADPLLDVFVAGADPVGVAVNYLLPSFQFPSATSVLTNYLKVHEKSMEGIRALIFNNDDNDGVVRVQSQSGELENECPSCVTRFDRVFHGFAPRYGAIQDRVVNLLKGGMNSFDLAGFPPSDHAQKIYYPSDKLDLFKVPLSGGAAICQSGMVPNHALAFAHVADEQNVIIMTRPVNPDGINLIESGAATKGMDVKPKSSNWGPQKGFLPVKQRYSKIWKIFTGEERKKKIVKYDSLAQTNLVSGLTLPRQLQVKACNGIFTVFIDENKFTGPNDTNALDEIVLVPDDDPTKVCFWLPEFSSTQFVDRCEDRGAQHQLIPFEVMATPEVKEDDGVTPRYITADYDLLMVGFFHGEDQGPPMPPTLPFKQGVGQITTEQEQLLDILNESVRQTGYGGGKVVHHGPENQFSGSPYIDYPITVFAPDNIPNGLFNSNTDGLVLSIQMGPPGFRDIYLKQFVNKMRKQGYDLYDNPVAPGWHWTWNSTAESYEPEDSKDLDDYVEQLPKNACDKYGGQKNDVCPNAVTPDDASNEKKEHVQKGRSISVTAQSILSPNPVYGSTLQFTIDNMKNLPFRWTIIDAYGKIRNTQFFIPKQGQISVNADVTNLEPGIYTILTDVFGQVGRFVRM